MGKFKDVDNNFINYPERIQEIEDIINAFRDIPNTH